MALAVSGEEGTVPPGPSFTTLEAGQLGHEIQFGGPGVAHEMGTIRMPLSLITMRWNDTV